MGSSLTLCTFLPLCSSFCSWAQFETGADFLTGNSDPALTEFNKAIIDKYRASAFPFLPCLLLKALAFEGLAVISADLVHSLFLSSFRVQSTSLGLRPSAGTPALTMRPSPRSVPAFPHLCSSNRNSTETVLSPPPPPYPPALHCRLATNLPSRSSQNSKTRTRTSTRPTTSSTSHQSSPLSTCSSFRSWLLRSPSSSEGALRESLFHAFSYACLFPPRISPPFLLE